MADNEHELQRSGFFLGLRLPADLYRSIEDDASASGLSRADVVRLRLRDGRMPSWPVRDNRDGGRRGSGEGHAA